MLAVATRPWVRLPLVTLAALAVQLSLFTDMRPFDAIADIMLLLVLASGMVAGPRAGAAVYATVGTVFGLRDAVTVHLVTAMLVVGVVNLLLAVPALWVQRWVLLGSDKH